MNTVRRFLLVWLLVLALPFQGVASASMLLCAPALPPAPVAAQAMMKSMDVKPHDHAAMLKAMAAADKAHGDHHGGVEHDGHGHDGHGHDGKSRTCADCCVGAAMAPAMLPVLALAPPQFISIPFRAGHVPSVDPTLPERPPRTTLA